LTLEMIEGMRDSSQKLDVLRVWCLCLGIPGGRFERGLNAVKARDRGYQHEE